MKASILVSPSGPVRFIRKMPLRVEEGMLPIKLGIFKGKLLLLSPVNNVNKFPKALSLPVQADFSLDDSFVNKDGFVDRRGITYLWNTEVH